MKTQSKEELDSWYLAADPWGYEGNKDDANRRSILLGEIPKQAYGRTLDIGCGEGFITSHLPGNSIVGVDLSTKAILRARENLPDPKYRFEVASIFDIATVFSKDKFDLVVITGVIYPQYIGESTRLIYDVIDEVLSPAGILVSVHINEWCRAVFPYLTLQEMYYPYREHTHCLRVYVK
jgi:trans-aconitate methyltransferase